jgi:hypothetical protein
MIPCWCPFLGPQEINQSVDTLSQVNVTGLQISPRILPSKCVILSSPKTRSSKNCIYRSIYVQEPISSPRRGSSKDARFQSITYTGRGLRVGNIIAYLAMCMLQFRSPSASAQCPVLSGWASRSIDKGGGMLISEKDVGSSYEPIVSCHAQRLGAGHIAHRWNGDGFYRRRRPQSHVCRCHP